MSQNQQKTRNTTVSQHGEITESGWELFQRESDFYQPGKFESLEFARKDPDKFKALRLQEETGIPKEFCGTDLSKFRFDAYSIPVEKMEQIAWSMVDKWDIWQRQGKGLYLWSKTAGSGKTFLACSIARSIAIKHGVQIRFVNAPDYIALVGESYNRERGTVDRSEIFRNCQLLVFDDIGAEKVGDWQRGEIFRIINNRLENGLVTIFTSNLRPDQLKNLDERTKSRINKASIPVQMPEQSIRQQRAEEERKDFLKMVLG